MNAPLIDPFGRKISYLRVSVTDRCDMRCVYCMADDMTFLPRDEVLSFEELERVLGAFVQYGVRRLRVTGGEPLVRKGIGEFLLALGERWIGKTNDSPALDELTLTTNGSRLVHYADTLRKAGMKRINVSMDTLDEARFASITRRGVLQRTLDGIKAARDAGLKVRINTVAMRGFNDDEFDSLIDWCGSIGADLCLIETMPMGDVGEDRTDRYLPLNEVRRKISERWTLLDSPYKTGGPARYYQVAQTGHRVGFITPMSHNFCESCNRVRLSCTGTLYTCLGQEDHVDLRAPIRAGTSDDALISAIAQGIARKPKGHDFVIGRRGEVSGSPARHMSVTGG